MNKRFPQSKKNGQSLVEYALLLSLVAVVLLVIMGIMGIAVTRIYAQMAAGLGASKDSAGDIVYSLSFSNSLGTDVKPQCGFLIGQGIGLYAPIETDTADNIPVSALTAYSDNNSPVVNPDGTTPITGNADSRYKVYARLAPYVGVTPPQYDLSICPRTLVVQSDKQHGGLTITSPVLVQDWSIYP